MTAVQSPPDVLRISAPRPVDDKRQAAVVKLPSSIRVGLEGRQPEGPSLLG
jgi:hypothetical protein